MKWVTGADIDRNDRCPCGSGLKLKHCCLPLIEARSDLRPRGSPVGTYLNSVDLWPRERGRVTVDRVAGLVRAIQPIDLVQSLAKIGLLLHEDLFKPKSGLEVMILKGMLPEIWYRKLLLWIGLEHRQKVIHRLLLPAAMRLAMLEANAPGPRGAVADNRSDVGPLLLHLNTVLENDYENREPDAAPEQKRRNLCASVYRLAFYSHHDELGSALGRHRAILHHGLAAVCEKHPPESFDFEGEFATAFGFPLDQMVAQTVGIWSHYDRLRKNSPQDPKEFNLTDRYFAGLKPAEMRKNAGKIFKYLGLPWEEHVRRMTERSQVHGGANLLQFFPIYDKPLLELPGGAYTVLDFHYLQSAASEGAYWSLFAHLLANGGTGDAQKLRGAVGRATEWYVSAYLRDAYPVEGPGRGLWLDWDGHISPVHGVPQADAVIREGDTLLFLEVTSSAVKPTDAVSCNPDTLEGALASIFLGRGADRESAKVRQLAGSIRAFREGRLRIPGIEAAEIQTIVPVLITLRYLPQNALLDQRYREIIRTDAECASIADDLQFLSLPSFEAALFLRKQGTPLGTLLAQWRESEYGTDPLVNYLSFTDRWPGRHPLLEGWMVEAFRSFGQILFGNPDVITVPNAKEEPPQATA